MRETNYNLLFYLLLTPFGLSKFPRHIVNENKIFEHKHIIISMLVYDALEEKKKKPS